MCSNSEAPYQTHYMVTIKLETTLQVSNLRPGKSGVWVEVP